MGQHEKLSMMTARSRRMDPLGGVPSLTPVDIAEACSGMPDAAYWLARVVYLGDVGAGNEYLHRLRGILRELRPPKNPETLKDVDPVWNIMLLCLNEMHGDNRCRGCGGTGRNHYQQKCKVCDGSGRKKYTDLSRARAACIPYACWPAYKSFYNRVYMRLLDLDYQISTHLNYRLRDEYAMS
jgi:hypothetical protein